MKLVVDTNITISALIRNSITRKILLHPLIELYAPEFMLEEIYRHIDLIEKKSGLSESEVSALLSIIFSKVTIVPSKRVMEKYGEAETMIGRVDEKDVPVLALALSIPNDGIWSEDEHLTRQSAVKVWKTKDLIKALKIKR
ncbi:MAG: PIN domain-containing protein [Candidatus Bathyarchaeia archaeon]